MRTIIILSLLGAILSLSAQTSVNGGKLNINTSRLTSIEAIPLSDESNSNAQLYLVDELHFGTIDLGKLLKIENHRFRYDIKNNLFEIEINGQSKYLSGFGVKNFTVINSDSSTRHFVQPSQVLENEEFLGGCFEILHSDEITLLGHYSAKLLPANYIEGLDVGTRSESYVLKSKYYLRTGKNELIEIKKRKDLIRDLGEKGKTVGKYIKENSLALKNRDDLITLTQFINAL